jgi:hypothetical protein
VTSACTCLFWTDVLFSSILGRAMTSARTFVIAAALSCAAAAGSVLAACDQSGTEANPPDAGDAGGVDAIVFDSPTFETTPGDGGADGGDGSLGTPAFGSVDFSQFLNGGGALTAAFYYTQDLPQPDPSCTAMLETDGGADAGGACGVTVCTAKDGGASDAASDAASPVTSVPNAGALTVTGGIFGDGGVVVAPAKGGGYFYNTTTPIFGEGNPLGVSAAGGSVPAFPTQTVIAPSTIVLSWTQPESDGGGLVIPTTQDLTVSWTGGVSGAHVIFKATAFPTGQSAQVACAWDATLGQGTIPAAALAPLASTATGAASWYQQTATTFDAGPWPVAITAETLSATAVHFQ